MSGFTIAGRRPRIFAPTSQLNEFLLALALMLAIALGTITAREVTVARLLVGAIGGLVFFIISATGRVTGLRLAFVWLVFLGFLRRFLIPFAGWSPQDPLLLVGPAFAVMLWVNGRGESPKKLDATTAMGALFAFLVLSQIFNPINSVKDGLTALVFWLPPVLWLFAGRTFSLEIHHKMARLIMWLGVPVALHGLRQTYFGLLSFEYTWVGVSGFGESIFLTGFKVRPFSTLVSPEEYGAFMGLVCVLWWASILKEPAGRMWKVPLWMGLNWALFLQGTRSVFLFYMVALFITSVVAAKGVGAKMAIVGLAVAVVGIGSQAVPPEPKKKASTAEAAFSHQLRGILNPLDPEGTGPLHLRLIRQGFDRSWDNPLGRGLVETGLVQEKKEKLTSVTTENDLSTVFVTLGILGGIVFVFFLMVVWRGAHQRYRVLADWYSLGALGGFLVATGRVWSGGLYAFVSLIWFMIGGLSRPHDEAPAPPEAIPDESPRVLAGARA